MFTADHFRAKAAAYKELTSTTESPEETKEFKKRERSATRMAENEDWLSENYDRTLHAPEEQSDTLPLREEKHILRCLGAALIMHWETIPAKLRRELFDSATAMGELPDTGELRGKIARFLESAKDDGKDEAPRAEGQPGEGQKPAQAAS
jgi:hypothetical protein